MADVTADAPERLYTSSLVECRSANGSQTIFGYAATFNSLSRRLPFGHEQIAPGFFDESAQAGFGDVVCRAEHDTRLLLGAVHSSTLRLAVDHRGLGYECDLPESPCGRDVYAAVSRKDYGGSSFSFNATDETWEYRNDAPLRILRSGRLLEVGPVTVPAYRDSSVAIRSLARHVDAPIEDIERLAAQGELRKLFTTSATPSPARTMTGLEALDYVQRRRWPSPGRRSVSGVPLATVQTYMKMQGRRYPPDQVAVAHAHYKRRLLLTAKRIGW
jgi:HK97 family phage prohead protease